MTNDRVQNPNEKRVVLAFNLPARARQAGHLDFNCHLDFDIWVLANGFGGKRMVRPGLYPYY
jgi:hypothetical protein